MSRHQGISSSGRPYTVIIAEGSKFQAKQLQQIFESEEYKIVGFAETGKELIELYNKNKTVNLITMELNLPVMDGYATFWEIKSMGMIPKILFITEETTPAVMKSLLDNGAMDFLGKPIKREKVLEKAKQIIDKVQTIR
ncbi:MAG: response regulator [Leptospiraceae bacterium]|nr:response regulator [Leptospiraceae bacterium]MCK6379961.1 response regulator [Leptospiraceae bacterium]NUM40079.1 response regulator [Leptospiraceae bacterium]